MNSESIHKIISDAFDLTAVDNKTKVEIGLCLLEDAIIGELSRGDNARYFLTHDEITDRLNLPQIGYRKNAIASSMTYDLQERGIVTIEGRKCWLNSVFD
ncbi:MAG: hypothetical protein OXH39_12895 [Candidatus Poribacteria bacterium]|nr:hypothetical protein [Candidatus Poribacteria bacterium]